MRLMFTPLRTRLGRIAIPAVLVAGSLAVAHPAAAQTYCVGQIACAAPATWVPSLQVALADAQASAEADHILLSGGTFTAPTTDGWTYNNPSSPVDITGAGVADTTLTGPAGLKTLLGLVGAP